ncbi:hypothetical protein [Aquimarina algiphila]|uniref:Uncharacterized protein n=1 Tax=Aquimarina algiphila TaxID=2047982 RepID=A0A554VB68_9FLAO|nr:hypothetical protein [Aquimarina algiphila]TSE03689.1 hypothetical protein FOF46_28740 [Aquimarina algiphila]
MNKAKYQEFIDKHNLKTLPKKIQEAIARCNHLKIRLENIKKDGVQTDEMEKFTKLQKQVTTCEEEIYLALQNHFADQLQNNDSLKENTTKKVGFNKEKEQLRHNEKILDSLKRMNWTTNIKRSELRRMGLKHPLNKWEIKIGEHTLKRSTLLSFKFNLI